MNNLVDTFTNRLNTAIRIRNIKPVELAQKTGIDKSKISSYMSGRYKAKQEGVYLLAKVLDVNEAWLMGSNVSMDRELNTDKLSNTVVHIPLISTVNLGYNYLAEEYWEGTVDLDKKIADTGEYFALKIKDDSMVPIFFEGDIVIIKKQNFCENNEVALVIVNGNEGILKKVRKIDDGITLKSFNQAHKLETYTNKEIDELPIIIAGVFQELRRTKIDFLKC